MLSKPVQLKHFYERGIRKLWLFYQDIGDYLRISRNKNSHIL